MEIQTSEIKVTYAQIAKEVTPKPLHNEICGKIEDGVFIPYGSVAEHFFKKQREVTASLPLPDQDVYFISDESGNIKIGIAENIKKRLDLLQTGNSQKLKLVKHIKGGGKETEKRLHNKYKKYHIRGEWYTNEVLTF